MASATNPNEAIQADVDDDEFDWEAAVKEIDVACQGTLASTSRPEEVVVVEEEDFIDTGFQPAQISHPKTKKSCGPARQSTLDKFVQTVDRKYFIENRSLSHKKILIDDENGDDFNGGEDTVCYTRVDLEAAKTWIYPVNVPLRDYQLSITKTALFSNTLVALPTGLGKTLIAAVVMYNYFRWFPEGKIVFTAPSRPLVMQQIEACHNTVGIPQEWTIDMTGQMSPPKRACFWKAKRVFFVTPQVLEKDIQAGTCLVKNLVCLVIDEAHRAMGNYSYCVVVRELMAVPVQLRILALTATPGSKQQTIQDVINNLHISKLEYRNESHPDVIPYVHDRKKELIEVAMGEDAIEINKLLLEAIQPFVTRLCAFGVLRNRDFQTLSPCELLNSRDKFRQAPPLNLPHLRYGEVEGYFGVLITLYHIRKLLSSHGIRPAYEMLEEKLQQGSFARLLSRNEVICKTKLLMQRSISHGAPNPKLSKMIEILIDHFERNDPKNSRVIIFSNFRGSVRDIMDSLSNIGEFVKATEFIGQSSGKALKGQTQKAQQAVLQKFRAGGYNVIVATSIGEEGLDIMEVDLVISCEGSELKGYLRKQANNKAVKKHMHNGGMNSFDFRTSPRMIPHICKPEVQFVELSIEQFVPRGRKVKDDPIHRSTFTVKTSDAENELIAKYFHPSKEDKWRPSLIAFPHFQVFPSQVHKVMHSFRTGMLIDTMQCLQGLSFSTKSETLLVEGETSSSQSLEAETIAQDDRIQEDLMSYHGSPKALSERKIADVEASPTVVSNCNEKNDLPYFTRQNRSVHCFLYGEDFVSVNAIGMVSILSVPDLPFLKVAPPHKSTTTNSTELLNPRKQNSIPSSTSPGDYMEVNMQARSIETSTNPAGARLSDHKPVLSSRFCNSGDHQEKAFHGVESNVLSTPSPKRHLNSEDIIFETPASAGKKIPIILADEPTSDFRDMEMSPRLTNMVEEGVVPESPIGETEILNLEDRSVPPSPMHVSPAKLHTGLPSTNTSSGKNEKTKMNNSASVGGYASAAINEDIHSPLVKMNRRGNARQCNSGSPINENIRTPLVDLSNNSCSKGWHLSSGESSKSVKPAQKFKRLRKYGDKKTESSRANLDRSFASARVGPIKHSKGKQKPAANINDFIEEEAEVSSDAEVSEDEEEKDNDSYDDSFIDDRINLTLATTQAEATGRDMMAIYRRSLLSPPVESHPICSTDLSPDILPYGSKIAETGSSSVKVIHSFRTPRTGSANQSTIRNPAETGSSSVKVIHSFRTQSGSANQSTVRNPSFCQMGADQISLLEMPLESSGAPREESKIDSRKRKLSFCQSEDDKCNGDVFYDDQFYEGLDFDELEAQATKILGCKSALSVERKQWTTNTSVEENLGLLNSPSFDLGI
ncbi:Helicase [Macleaya cordata]|uniref:Helicase n=1 Tax=Macleaya cordata TaxID=56857 RepID=A0A200QDZ1_MACCD|nr:Helicase [Macleaya cordata]